MNQNISPTNLNLFRRDSKLSNTSKDQYLVNDMKTFNQLTLNPINYENLNNFNNNTNFLNNYSKNYSNSVDYKNLRYNDLIKSDGNFEADSFINREKH